MGCQERRSSTKPSIPSHLLRLSPHSWTRKAAFEFLEPGTGVKKGGVMRSEENYENAPADIAKAIEQAEVIPDFLPSPDQLVLKEGQRR